MEPISIEGQPLHVSKEHLRRSYDNSISSYLEDEASNSAGSYILVDNNLDQIISSPGFEGGYIHKPSSTISTTLSDILLREDIGKLRTEGITRYLDKIVEHYWPFTTPFEDIFRIPPGMIVRFGKEDLNYESYLFKSSSSPGSFKQALEGSLRSIQEESVDVMFSGGADSLAILHAANSTLESDVRAVTIDIGPNSNSAGRAEKVGSDVGYEVDKIELGAPPSDSQTLEHIGEELSRDFCQPFAPHHALHDSAADLILSGQNMDTILASNMMRPQIRLRDHLSHTQNFSYILKQIFSNYPKTQLAGSYPHSALPIAAMYNMICDDSTQLSFGRQGFIAGFLSTDMPFVIRDADGGVPNSQANVINNTTTNVASTKYLHFIQGMHNAAKIITGSKLVGNGVQLPASWGPMLSRYLTQPLSFKDTVSPKKEVYEYLYDELDYNYLIESISESNYLKQRSSERNHRQSMTPTVLRMHQQCLDMDDSVLLKHSPKDARRRIIESFDLVEDILSKDSGEYKQLWEGHRLLNLEKLCRVSYE